MKAREKREEQARILTAARSKLDEIKDDTPAERAAEIEAEHDRMMADYDKLGAAAERLERLEAAEGRMARDPRRPRGEDVRSDDAAGQDDEGEAPPDYLSVFEKYLRFGREEMSGEERRILRSGRPGREAEKEMRAQASGTDAAGGFTVPEGNSGEIDKAIAEWGPMWNADIVRELNTTSGNRIGWPTVDDTAREGEAQAENTAATDDNGADVVFSEKQLDAYLHGTEMVRVSRMLLEDTGVDLNSIMVDLFAERLGRGTNRLLTTGTGTDEPEGIVTGAGAGITAASATAITPDELHDMLHSVDPAYRASPKCRWQFNDSTLNVIRKLKDGQGNYLWQMGDVRQGEPDRLLEKPFSVNQAMASIATGQVPIIFGDHSRYVVRKVRTMLMLVLEERFAEFYQFGMIAFRRFDGVLLNSAAVKKLTMA